MLPGASRQTGDADVAQHYSVSSSVEDSLPSVLDTLRSVDPTFREVPHRSDPKRTTQFENASRYKVEFLTPNRGSDDYVDHARSEEHTSELQSLMRISYAVFCLKKKTQTSQSHTQYTHNK